MASQSWAQELVNITASGTLYNTYTTAKSVLTSTTATAASTGLITLPPNFFQLGGRLEIDIAGAISNRVTGPDTFTVQVMVGSVIAFTTGAINLTTTAHTTIPCIGRIWLTCRSVGNGTLATLMGQSYWQGQMIAQAASLADNAGGTGNCMAPNTAPAVGTGFDSTLANTLDLWVAQSVSNAGNGFQLHQYSVKSWGNSAA
jgi:hypothetical protein